MSVAAIFVVAALSAGCGGDESRRQLTSSAVSFAHDQPIVAARSRVDELGPRRIGADYACAVLTKPTEQSRRTLLVFVTSPTAAQRARRLAQELFPDLSSRMEVRITSARLRHATIAHIRDVVAARVPPTARGWRLGIATPLDRDDCPPVEITLPPRGQADQSSEQWAAEAVRQYGADRVAITRGAAPHRTRG